MRLFGLMLLASVLISNLAAAEDAGLSSLQNAKTLRCEPRLGTVIDWESGEPKYKAGIVPKEPDLIDSIDLRTGTARMLGNAGSATVRAWASEQGLHFLEQSLTGNQILTTVFGILLRTEIGRPAFPFVSSRHINLGGPATGGINVSQWSGVCYLW